MELLFARQPIFDRNRKVVAYELLYRSDRLNEFDGTDERVATAKVINAVFYSPDGRNLLGGKTAFINFPASLLVDDSAELLPRNRVVVEILETVEPTPEVIEACKRLRSKGYALALDDFVDLEGGHPLVQFADYVKIDLTITDRKEGERIFARYRRSGCRLLAEKVETEEDFRWAAALGFSLFQGYFFSRPIMSSVREAAGFKLNFLELLKNLSAPQLDFTGIASIVNREPTLSYKLLRFANSALLGRKQPARTVKQALSFVGEIALRKWLSIVIIMDLASDTADEVMTNVLMRARLCEILAEPSGLKARKAELFTLGLFSRLDKLFSQPLSELIADINLADDIRNTLLETVTTPHAVSRLWTLILAYEVGDWNRACELLPQLNLEPATLTAAYFDAVSWAESMCKRAGPSAMRS
ncbi:MAG TPA: EAL domain-containing protein [Bryobacteraceae bacterium]|jgi:EAL and modified HD-GYP domain-containing signal transduction protein|nr:EAL domain-containing protein [Bryobacteraceae bacterium]